MIISKKASAKEVRILRDAEVLDPTAQTTTNSYADLVGSLIDAANYASIAMTIKNTHATNHIYWKVLASINGTDFVEVRAQSQVDANSAEIESFTETPALYRYYKVQVKTVSSGNHGTAVLSVIGK